MRPTQWLCTTPQASWWPETPFRIWPQRKRSAIALAGAKWSLVLGRGDAAARGNGADPESHLGQRTGAGGRLLDSLLYILVEKNAALEQHSRNVEEHARFVTEANRKLLRSNREMDDFTYAVAHDLKEPLRGIETLSGLCLAESKDGLAPSLREYMELIRSSGIRMRRLVEDLLRFSRVVRKEYPCQSVPFRELIDEVTDTLRFSGETAATIEVQPALPTLHCDRVRVFELFQNLLSNSLKFTNGAPPRIEIGHKHARRGGENLFWVRDNGPGIPEEDRERIFQIFQRTRAASATYRAAGSG